MARTGQVVQIVGGKEVRSALRAAGGRPMLDELREAQREVAVEVVDEARAHVPWKTGRLLASTRPLASQRSARAVAGGTSSSHHAGAVHWGRKRGNVWGNRRGTNVVKARPFLWDAAQRVRSRGSAEASLKKRLDDLFGRLFGR